MIGVRHCVEIHGQFYAEGPNGGELIAGLDLPGVDQADNLVLDLVVDRGVRALINPNLHKPSRFLY